MKQLSIKAHDGLTPLELRKFLRGKEFLTGFTLIEMMVVVIIIGILASVAMPRYQKTVERSRISEALSILGSIRTAQYRYASEHNKFTNNLGDLDMNVTQYGRYFNFSPSNANPFGNGDEPVAAATRDGGRYGGCSQYTIVINESGNLSASGIGSCAELSAILN